MQHVGAYRHQYCCWLGVADIAIASHNNNGTYALHISNSLTHACTTNKWPRPMTI